MLVALIARLKASQRKCRRIGIKLAEVRVGHYVARVNPLYHVQWDRANTLPPGYFVWMMLYMKCGSSLPYHRFFVCFLNTHKMALAKLAPNGYNLMVAIFVICHDLDLAEPLPLFIRLMYEFSKHASCPEG